MSAFFADTVETSMRSTFPVFNLKSPVWPAFPTQAASRCCCDNNNLLQKTLPESTSLSLHAASPSYRTTHVHTKRGTPPVTASCLFANITTQNLFIYLFKNLFKSYSNTCHYVRKTYVSFSIAGR